MIEFILTPPHRPPFSWSVSSWQNQSGQYEIRLVMPSGWPVGRSVARTVGRSRGRSRGRTVGRSDAPDMTGWTSQAGPDWPGRSQHSSDVHRALGGLPDAVRVASTAIRAIRPTGSWSVHTLSMGDRLEAEIRTGGELPWGIGGSGWIGGGLEEIGSS